MPSYNEVTGHPLKTESGESDQIFGASNASGSKHLKSEFKPTASLSKSSKSNERTVFNEDLGNRHLKRNAVGNQSVNSFFTVRIAVGFFMSNFFFFRIENEVKIISTVFHRVCGSTSQI